MLRVLALPSEPLASIVPDYWRPNIEDPSVATSKPTPGCPPEPSPDKPCHLGSDVLPPIAKSRPQPAYTQLATDLQCQGSTHLRLVVDETGAPSRVGIVRPIGCGLDDLAVRSLQRWTFQPATQNGRAVPVETEMLVKFRLE